MASISVIIPCFNQGVYLAEAVASVLEQNFDGLEIIVVNDGSTEQDTINILNNFSADKTLLLHTDNRGVAAARNYGISQATGDYILPLDADDYISGNYLREARENLEANLELKLVYCNGRYFDSETGPIQLPEYDPKTMLQQNLVFATAMFRKADWQAVGGYDENFLTGWEDWDFWLTLIKDRSEICKLPGEYFHYRIKAGSRNHALQGEQLGKVERQLFLKHIQTYLKFFPYPLTIIRGYGELEDARISFEKYKAAINGSASYRIGDALLKPFKFLRGLGKK
ncbi:MAG: glycosyl transferase [Ferruginibacter sp.]|nr:glycosyl transferase [Ferruginibacter sp.]